MGFTASAPASGLARSFCRCPLIDFVVVPCVLRFIMQASDQAPAAGALPAAVAGGDVLRRRAKTATPAHHRTNTMNAVSAIVVRPAPPAISFAITGSTCVMLSPCSLCGISRRGTRLEGVHGSLGKACRPSPVRRGGLSPRRSDARRRCRLSGRTARAWHWRPGSLRLAATAGLAGAVSSWSITAIWLTGTWVSRASWLRAGSVPRSMARRVARQYSVSAPTGGRGDKR